MSDWSTTAPEDGSIPWKCIEAGNDLIMPGSEKDDADIRQAYADGRLSEKGNPSLCGKNYFTDK